MGEVNDATRAGAVDPDDCPYCGGVEEITAIIANGKQDFIPCPHPCHRLAATPSPQRADASEMREACAGIDRENDELVKAFAVALFDHNPSNGNRRFADAAYETQLRYTDQASWVLGQALPAIRALPLPDRPATAATSPEVEEPAYIPLVFYDASDPQRRVADLAEALERGNGRLRIACWKKLIADLNAAFARAAAQPQVGEGLSIPDDLRKAAYYASDGPWEIDREWNEDGEYGSGPNPGRGYDDYIVVNAQGRTVLDSINSDAKSIEVEYDEDGGTAWDQVGRRNAEFVVAATNFVRSLIAAQKGVETKATVEKEAGNGR